MKQLVLAFLLAVTLFSYETTDYSMVLKMESDIEETVIGKVEEKKYILTATIDQLNALFEEELKNNPTVKLVNFSINKDVVEGKEAITYYYLKATNRSNTFKMAKELELKNGLFFVKS